jgi:hypothetical protein
MLPTLLPMLTTAAALFDATDFGFEIKWDGIRALTAVDRRLLSLAKCPCVILLH